MIFDFFVVMLVLHSCHFSTPLSRCLTKSPHVMLTIMATNQCLARERGLAQLLELLSVDHVWRFTLAANSMYSNDPIWIALSSPVGLSKIPQFDGRIANGRLGTFPRSLYNDARLH